MNVCWPYRTGVPSSLIRLQVCRMEIDGREMFGSSL